MAQHTPAPWFRKERFVYALGDDATNRFTAIVQDPRTSKEELEANARLMRASPQLLDAVQRVIDWAEIDTFPHGFEGLYEDLHRVVKFATKEG